MAHDLDMSNSRVNFAHVGESAWHRLGNRLNHGATLEQWSEAAGFAWEAVRSPVMFRTTEGADPVTMPGRFVIHRSDTGAPLSVMSGNFRITQPAQVMEFFRDIIKAGGAKMETAGMLAGGAKFWALARFDDQFDMPGDSPILPYLMLATSLDGSLSNTAAFTTVRVVCQNTLAMANRMAHDGAAGVVRVPHSTDFNADQVKSQLGLMQGRWEQFKKDARSMSQRTISREDAVEYFLSVLYPKAKTLDLAETRPTLGAVLSVYENGIGQQTDAAKDTVWGLLQACTRYVDHEKKAASDDTRLQQAWFGAGAALKRAAYEKALELV